jgi:hypothetical protein
MRHLAWLVVLVGAVAHAEPGSERSERARVEKKLASAIADFKDCGARPKAVFDWKSYDAIDWTTAGKDKLEYLSSERGTLDSLGTGLDKLCADQDYRAVLGKIDTVIYKPSSDSSIKLVAVISGTKLTFTDYIFGSTRDVNDFENATRKALDNSAVTAVFGAPPDGPASPKHKVPVKTAPASSAWDGKYANRGLGGTAGLCVNAERAGTLTVTSGKFSFAWFVDDWLAPPMDAKPVKVGRVDGIVHADGSATTTVTFSEPVLKSTMVATIKIKRELDALTSLPLTFTRERGDKVVTLDATLFPNHHCTAEWAKEPPKTAKVDKPPPSPKPASTPSTTTAHPSSGGEEREAERQRQVEAERQRQDSDKFNRRQTCRTLCETKHDECRENRCEATASSCRERCDGISDSYEKGECRDRCSNDHFTCSNGCNDELRTCKEDCDTR